MNRQAITISEQMWMVRAGERGFLFDEFKNKNLVAIGWKTGDISKISSPEEIKKIVRNNYPENSDAQVIVTAGQINRFKFEFKVGDKVVTYNPDRRVYLVGEIAGDYEYNQNVEYHNTRKVKWFEEISRDKLTTSTKNTLGAISTIFDVGKDGCKEVLDLLAGKKEPIEEPLVAEEKLDEIKEDLESKSREFIKDKILKLTWEEMQELVAGILRGMGYKTMISPKGPDMGKDIIASPDGLCLQEPKIKVEVKHREGQMGSSEVRSFIGALRVGEKGVYVSTGGFSKDAKHEAERSDKPLTLVDSDVLVDLIISYYDKFDMDAVKLIPLTKIYWPS